MPARHVIPHRSLRVAMVIALSLMTTACIAPAGGNEPATTSAPRTTTTTTTLPPATLTDAMDPYAPGLGNGGYDAVHYHVDMAFSLEPPSTVAEGEDYDPAEAEVRIAATTTIEVVTTRSLDQIAFDFTGGNVSVVTVDGADATFDRKPAKLIIDLPEPVPAGDELTIAVQHSGAPDMVESKVARVDVGWVGTPGGTWHFRADPDGAHRWFPVNDHPMDKATFLFDILVPIDYAAAASGSFERTYSGIESAGYRWAVDDEIPVSSVTAIIGDLELVVDDQSTTASGVEIRHLLPSDMVNDPPAALDHLPDMIGWLEERFGPYPYEAFGVAVVDGENVGLGANTWALMTREQIEDEDAELAIIGRLARHWFGDSLTPATWKDVWLSTSFVRYTEWLWIERDLGDRPTDTVASLARRNVQESGWPPPNEPRVGDVYVGSVFLHGAITLHAMRLRMGDAAFFDMVSAFYTEFAGGWATTTDLDRVVLKEGGREIRYLYDTWLTADELPGFPDR